MTDTMTVDEMTATYGDPIDIRTRDEAIEAGDLVDLPDELVADSVFRTFPSVAMTRAAYADVVEWTDADNDRKGTLQDVKGRAHDVLWMCGLGAQRNTRTHRFTFEIVRVPRAGRGLLPRPVQLVAELTIEEYGPALTISLPGED